MPKLLVRTTAMLLTLAAALLNPSSMVKAAAEGFTTLDVNGEAVRIYRDDFGIPHIFAETNRGLFEAYGYTVAQDRLW
jgi:penicillin G amidase